MLNKGINWLNIVIFLLVFFSLGLVFLIFNKDDNDVVLEPNLVIVEQQINVNKRTRASLLAYVENVTNYEIKWSSSNGSVASVSQDGIVSGNEYGTAVITATYTDVKGIVYTDNCIVNVIQGANDNLVTGVNFSGEALAISLNNQLKLMPIIVPEDAMYDDIQYTSSDLAVATVSEDGLLKAIGVGVSCIKVIVDNEYSDEIYVNVVSKNGILEYIDVPQSLNFKEENMKLNVGDILSLEYEYFPSNIDHEYLTWESSNPDVVSVENGVVTCKTVGEAFITVASINGISAKVNVFSEEKIIPVENVSLTASSTSLKVGATLQLTYNITPTGATNKNVSFKSSDESIATVDDKGLVTAKKKGSVTISITTEDGNKTSSVSINVANNSSSGSSSNVDGPYQGSTGSTGGSCSKKSPPLSFSYNGSSISHGSTITMKVGQTIYINVSLPTYCGSQFLITRTTADGESNWRNYLSGSSVRSSGNNASSYKWKLTAKKVTNGVIVSQTAEFQTELYYSVKSMGRITIKITN